VRPVVEEPEAEPETARMVLLVKMAAMVELHWLNPAPEG